MLDDIESICWIRFTRPKLWTTICHELIYFQPSWTMYLQVMTFEEAEKSPWNPFDLTKV